MSRYFSYLNTAVSILAQYKGEEPFSNFLKKYFSLHKKYGSSDRKNIAGLCFVYFRTGQAMMNLPKEEKIIQSLFLCSATHNLQLAFHRPDLDEKVSWPLKEKIKYLPDLEQDRIFSWTEELGREIEKGNFILSHLIQPDLFIRCRPGKQIVVEEKIKGQGIAFREMMPSCLAINPATKIDSVIALNSDAVIQDLSSQRVGELMKMVPKPVGEQPIRVWDCCAASGGKSILAKDILGKIELTVSDIRKTVLINLQKRFREAGIGTYKSFMADLSKPPADLPLNSFDFIVADLPCTGSGTWSRAPEHLSYFKKEKITEYTSLQMKILSNVIPYVKKGGYLLYSTCSVFEKENDAIVDWLLNNNQAELVEKKYFKGYEKKADTLFGALIKMN